MIDNLKRRGFELPSRCPLCEREEESVDHLLLNCSIIKEIWNKLREKFKCS